MYMNIMISRKDFAPQGRREEKFSCYSYLPEPVQTMMFTQNPSGNIIRGLIIVKRLTIFPRT